MPREELPSIAEEWVELERRQPERAEGPQSASESVRISYADGAIIVRQPIAKIGRYALFEQFASGGMATVHFGRLDGAGGFRGSSRSSDFCRTWCSIASSPRCC